MKGIIIERHTNTITICPDSPRVLESFSGDFSFEKLPEQVVFKFRTGIRQQLDELNLPVRLRVALKRAKEAGRIYFNNEPEESGSEQLAAVV